MTTQEANTYLQNNESIIKEIISLGKNKGFDFENMNEETLDKLMKAWINNGRVFAEKIKEAPVCVVKSMLGLQNI